MRFVVFFQAIQIPNKVATGGNSFSGVEREGSICGEKSIQLNIAPPTIAPVVKLIAGTEVLVSELFVLCRGGCNAGDQMRDNIKRVE